MRPDLASQYRSSVPDPITPTIQVYAGERGDSCTKQSLGTLPVETCHGAAPFRDGLPTPPSDMTGVAYNTIVPPPSYGGNLPGLPVYPYAKVSSNSRADLDVQSAAMMPAVKAQSQPASSHKDISISTSAPEPADQKKSTNTSIASYLQIPSSINDSKGSLAEFASQMTCLFWFEKTAKLKAIEERLNPTLSLVPEAIPTIGFQKWVTTILSTTQVSQNVILLALMFIYRLKKFNPGVRGKKGSEFRLMTIALMLGNKFLDDNTYTNKTWAEVSGISVQEIHVMEVEFLSNIRYNLLVSADEWKLWHVKLGLFADYFNKASRIPVENELSPHTPVLHISPNLGSASRAQSLSPSSNLPSPPASNSLLGQQSWNLPFNGLSYTGPQIGGEIPRPNPRKRSRDEQVEEHPVKRMATSNSIPPVSTLPPSSVINNIPTLPPVLTPTSVPPSHVPMVKPVPRLPRPNFPPASTAMAQNVPAAASQLPTPFGRTMAPVYNPSPNWAQPVPTSTAIPPVAPALYNPSMSLPDPSRHNHSPFAVSSAAVSPALSAYSIHTPQTHLSPSFFLANRYSPYRPVRTVNTLLIPPPSGSLHQQRNIPFDHMHYQPLGKSAAERKTGLLPYLHHGAWPQGHFIQPVFQQNQNYSS